MVLPLYIDYVFLVLAKQSHKWDTGFLYYLYKDNTKIFE